MTQRIRENLHRFRVEQFIKEDFLINRKDIGFKSDLKAYQEYNGIKLLKNIRQNRFSSIYEALGIILNEPFVNKKQLYINLMNYRHEVEGEKVRNRIYIHEDALSYEMIILYPDENIDGVSLMDSVHELDHFASFKFKKGQGYSMGFMEYRYAPAIQNEKYQGLNEGFTEYLMAMQVNNGNFVTKSGYYCFYVVCSQYAKCLSKIIGFDKMKELYYNADIESLKEIMNQYNKQEDTEKFLECLDHIYRLEDKEKEIKFESEEIIFCNQFLENFSISKFGRNIVTEDIVHSIEKTENENYVTDQLKRELDHIEVKKVGGV